MPNNVITLSSEIQLHEGWADFTADPVWTGTVWEFADANRDEMDGGKIRHMMENLRSHGLMRMGGGASPKFTVATPTRARMARAA